VTLADNGAIVLWGSIMAALLGLLFFPMMLYLTIRVTRFVWHQEKLIPCMLFSLSAASFFLVCYFVWLVCIYAWPAWMCSYSPPMDTVRGFACSNTFFPNLPSFFLALSVILNLDKWIYFELRIISLIRIGE
jgi:hypothetical protein